MDYEIRTHRDSIQRIDPADRPTRILRTMLRVSDLDRSLDFYIGNLGMKLLRRQDYPAGRFTLAFVGYDSEDTGPVLEFTHIWDKIESDPTETQWGHIVIAVNDVSGICAEMAEAGVKIVKLPRTMRHTLTRFAVLEDPDGYKIELIEC